MFNKSSKLYPWLVALAVVIFSQACAAATPVVSSTPSSQPAQSLPLNTAMPAIQNDPVTPIAPTPTPTPPPTPTHSIVFMVTAVNGNIFIRRGPNLAYNPISVLKKGESATGLARDVLARWVQIPIPGQPDKTGWVSIQTDHTVVNGNVRDLPEFMTVDWPVASYLRNCTHHQMIIKPGDTIIPSLYGAPGNEVWIFPGVYTVYDFDLPDQPEVMSSFDLREGLEIDIRTDGSGETRKCP
ncbi:MAG: SH3 domain-containing protein [Anaerolineales bacterium]|nr:SH3 domain-containing protein [Anaerolineales bacterium]